MKKLLVLLVLALGMNAGSFAKNLSATQRARIETEKLVNTYRHDWGMEITPDQELQMLEAYKKFFRANLSRKPEEEIVSLHSYRDEAYKVYTGLALDMKKVLTQEQYKQFLISENSRIYQVQTYLIHKLGLKE